MILGSLFQDGAVLQRDKNIMVWGWAAPRTLVEISFDGSVSRTRSASDGKFVTCLPAHEAGGPYELTVFTPENGEKAVVKDVLVGEVWLASGQSNMEYKLGSDMRTTTPPGEILGRVQEKQFKEMIMDADKFRIFTVELCASGAPESTCRGSWQPVNAENCSAMSAVAAWFGLDLQYQLDVPIGIVVSAVGGSEAETWMSFEALNAVPETSEMAESLRFSHWESPLWAKAPEENQSAALEENPGIRPDSGNEGLGMGYAENDFDDSSWQSMVVGGSWIRQNICGNGAVWLRKTVDLPESWVNVPLRLSGGAVDKHDISYFNGVEIGRTGEGLDTTCFNTARQYPIASGLAKAGKNTVAIRGFSFAFDGAVSGEWYLVNEQSGEKIRLNGDWKAKAEYDRGDAANSTDKKLVSGPGNIHTPGILFNGMIRPLLPYVFRGTIWYQGESNASTVEQAVAYRDIMQGLIDDWRWHFCSPSMPFIMVQLAGFGGKVDYCQEAAWGELRESQRLVAASDPDAYMASAIDIGNQDDIHPENKRDVGKRLAMCALHHVYGYDQIVPSGPELFKYEVDGSRIRISFKYADGLKLKDDCVSGFAIAGKDGRFYLAENVKVDGDTVEISSSLVKEPCKVRYAWSNYLVPALFNAVDFPASSFQIDLQK